MHPLTPSLVGLGTYLLEGRKCQEIVEQALSVGYRHIDTAFSYANHKEVGRAIRNIPREALFLTTKFTVDQVKKPLAKSVEQVIELALKQLGTPYLDLLLIHWPEAEAPLEEILAALVRQTEKGLLKFAGVSNYTRHHLQDAYSQKLKVSYNQVEFHPYLYQKELLDFCTLHGTQLIAYRPFGKGKLLAVEPLFTQIGNAHGKSGAQVILRWLIQKNIPSVVKASDLEHLQENIAVFDFHLSEEEMQQLDQLGKKQMRFCKPDSPVFDY
jgi:2,5-diketo-D-gluconate reductase B